MVLGSHNSWSYLRPKKWWMKIIAFTARCQSKTIREQYELGVRCFDLRIRFDKYGNTLFAHGIVEYDVDPDSVHKDLMWIDNKGDCMVRVLHEARTEKQYNSCNISIFQDVCRGLKRKFANTKFWCGRNLYNWHEDYDFGFYPTYEEKYASVCSPKLIDDWWPWWFAKFHNKQILKDGSKADVLLMDFVDIK